VAQALANEGRKLHRLLATENAMARLTEEIGTLRIDPEMVRPSAINALLGPDAVHQGLYLEADPLPGPDLDDLVALRGRAREVGADEVLLVSDDGWAVEAANSSLMWWEDDVFCIPSRALPALDGVTVGLILEEVARRGIEIRERLVTPVELMGHEVWLTSALQGIRPVSRWVGPDGSSVPAASAPRAGEWVGWLLTVA
jgi:hypothetical protein